MDSARPALESTLGRPAMARMLGWFYLAGAVLGGLSLVLPHARDTDVLGVVAVVAVAFLGGGLLVTGANLLPAVAIPGFLVVGSLLITASVYFDGHAGSVYAFFYVWVGVEAFYFLGRRLATLQVLLAGAAYGCALSAVASEGFAEQRWLLTIGTALVAGLLVAYQRDRIGALVHRLTDAARTDPLTGLLNRRGFEETFKLELERARRSGSSLSVVAGDLDGFKLVNDRLGHHAGD